MNVACLPAWTADGREIVFSVGAGWARNLWRLSVANPEKPQRLASVERVAASQRSAVTGATWPIHAYLRTRTSTGMELADGGITERRSVRLVASSRIENLPGSARRDQDRLSIRSGQEPTKSGSAMLTEGIRPDDVLWRPPHRHPSLVSRRAADRVRLTPGRDQRHLHGRVNGGKPLRLTTSPAQDMMPSWSWDGKRIYFDSTRGGSRQVWRVPAPGRRGNRFR